MTEGDAKRSITDRWSARTRARVAAYSGTVGAGCALVALAYPDAAVTLTVVGLLALTPLSLIAGRYIEVHCLGPRLRQSMRVAAATSVLAASSLVAFATGQPEGSAAYQAALLAAFLFTVIAFAAGLTWLMLSAISEPTSGEPPFNAVERTISRSANALFSALDRLYYRARPIAYMLAAGLLWVTVALVTLIAVIWLVKTIWIAV